MPTIDNMLAILWLLRSGEKITAQQIAEKLELNIRTVYRYIDTLSTSGVPIVSEPGHHGGYSLLDHFKEAPLFFDAEEQTSLIHAARFAQEAGYYGGDSLQRAMEKLRNYVNEKQEKHINIHASTLEVMKGHGSHSIESSLKDLETAVAKCLSIAIQYPVRDNGQPLDRMIDPYKVIFWNSRWYVIGFCHLRQENRSFRVDRLISLTVTDHSFSVPQDFSPQDFFMENLLPALPSEGIETFCIEGKPKVIDDLCRHWFLNHYLQKREDGHAVFLLDKEMINTFVPYLLLPYGTSIRVIAPKSLQKKLIEVLSELLHFHQSSSLP
ncbi:helix-turn-helix transcriptional regulator [Sporosarcina cyprini]|uniref:helix-turn-helix transcriptional regulator n=1 Tax=Sporosarcina cyprini TaxID=2910523 RepID=UPI001EDE3F9E|nr:YafY family protein [Sporosarcina cyprini]MCG3088907.1 YafY family transcriptional regulator [Sporosarcina cyprini]